MEPQLGFFCKERVVHCKGLYGLGACRFYMMFFSFVA